MENIELYIISSLFILLVIVDLYEKNKDNKYWKDYYKRQYFMQKDLINQYADHIERLLDEKQ